MNTNNPERVDRLAAEYVLGTLHGAARRRFEAWMLQAYHVRAAVWRWESELLPLGELLDPVQPPPSVWRQVRERIGSPGHAPLRDAAPRWAFWRLWSFGSTAVAMALAVSLLITPTPPVTSGPERVAVIAADATDPQWLVSLDVASGQLRSRAVNAVAASADRAFELWMLPTDGSAPQSLGLLPVSGGQTVTQLSPVLRQALQGQAGLAISIEPSGGSPTGAPTGPVVFQAAFVDL